MRPYQTKYKRYKQILEENKLRPPEKKKKSSARFIPLLRQLDKMGYKADLLKSCLQLK